jgi:small conductance mechanosensitive channel
MNVYPELADQAAVARKLADAMGDFAVDLAVAALILVLTLWVSSWVAHAVRRALERFSKTREDRTLQGFGASSVRVAVLIVGGIAVLTRLGVETTSIIAILGAASLAVGLALQGALGNVAAGVMLLVLRPYQVGDFVEIGGRQGTVKSLKLFTTDIDTPDNVRIVAPNGKVFGDLITNFTAHAERRVDVLLAVDLEDDLEAALRVLRQVADEHPQVLKAPEPVIEVTAVTDGRAQLALHAWAPGPAYGVVKSELFVRARTELAKAGVRPAYPRQMPPKPV